MRRVGTGLGVIALVACGQQAQAPRAAPKAATSASPVAAGAPSATADANPILGTLDGQPIRQTDLDEGTVDELRDIRNELEQRRLHLLWVGIERAIDERLLTSEAARQGLTPAELRAREIEGKVAAPSPEEIQAFYDRYADRIGIELEKAAPLIARQMTEQRAEEAEAEYLAHLRDNAKVTYSLPMPDLPRIQISADGAPSKGPEDAPVTVVEFSDFECPYCSRARKVLDQLAHLYPTTVRLVYRDFPLSQHPRARPAAEAAQCAHEQGKFWQFHDLLFDNPEALQPDDLQRYAKQVELDLDSFSGCLASDRPKEAVRGHEADGHRYGVEGTPAIFVNGIKLIGLLPLPVMQALIDHELTRQP